MSDFFWLSDAHLMTLAIALICAAMTEGATLRQGVATLGTSDET